MLWAATAYGYSGTCGIWAQARNGFVGKNFAGTQAGYDAAKAYIGTNGAIFIYGGCEGALTIGTLQDSVFVYGYDSAKWTVYGKSGSWRDRAGQARLDVDSLGITVTGTGIIPRLGPASSATTGGAIRIVDGVTFPLTVAGVQAALDEISAVGGGEVWVPATAGIVLATTPILIANRCTLVGFGNVTDTPTFTGNASTNVRAAIENSDSTGGQQMVGVRNIYIDGNQSTGARMDRGVRFKKVFVGSYIRDVTVVSVSGVGVEIAGDASNAVGQLVVENVWTNNTGHYGIYVSGGARNIWLRSCSAERPGRNTSALAIIDNNSTAASLGVQVDGFYTEVQDTMSSGIYIDGASGVEISNYTASVPSGSMRSAVRISNSNNNNHARSPSGITIRNMYSASDTLIEDHQNSLTYTVGPGGVNNPYAFVDWYSTPLFKGTTSGNGYRASGQKIGIQPAKRGPDVSSASTIAPHLDGHYYVITGTTTVTSITGAPYFLYKTTVLEVSGALQFTDGSNLNLNGNFVGNATGGADLLGLIWDGTNWNEAFRSLN